MRPALTTLFCDASYSQQDQLFGAAWWIKSSGQSQTGTVTGEAFSVAQAELAGILAGVIRAVATHPGSEAIVLSCDCLQALSILSVLKVGTPARTSPIQIPRAKSISPEARAVAEEVRTALRGLPLWLKHVKGHQKDTGDARHYVNNRNDSDARRVMREARDRKRASASSGVEPSYPHGHEEDRQDLQDRSASRPGPDSAPETGAGTGTTIPAGDRSGRAAGDLCRA